MRVIVGLLAALAVGALLWWGMQTKDERSELPSALAGRPAPAFALEPLPSFRERWGGEMNLADYLGKQPIVLNFWASWCYPACYEEAPILEAAWRRWGDRVLFVGVNTQDEIDKAEKFVTQFGLSFPNLYDPRGRVGIDYGMYGVPETFAISAGGRVVRRHAGSIDAAQLEALIREVLP